MQPWKTLSRQTLLTIGKWLSVEKHSVQLPDGQIIDDWPWVVTPDYINVVPVMTDGRILCFRQTKYAVEGVSLAPVGGYIEPNEAPLPAAQRELLEETGCAATEWVDLGHYAVDGNRGAGVAHFFLALGAKHVQPINADDLEAQEIVYLTRAEVEASLKEFKVLGWSAIIAMALLHLEKTSLPGASDIAASAV